MELNWERDQRIDESALDVEWLEQAPLAIRYAKYWLYLRKKAQIAHENLKTVRSELVHRVNLKPAKTTGKEKPNIADIEAYYRRHSRYKQAKTEWMGAQDEADFAEVVKNEICFTRKAALEGLVALHGQQYFAGPSSPHNLTKEREKWQRQRNTDNKVALGMRRNK